MNINFSNHFQALVDKYGDREVLVNVERNRRFTYVEYHLLSNRIVNMMTERLGLGVGDCFVNILENDNMALLHFPTVFKGHATGAFANFRDSIDEHKWQIDYVKPRVAFIETSLLETHHAMLRESGIEIVCMDPPEQDWAGVRCFWDLLENVSDENPNIILDDREHTALIRFTGGTTGMGKAAAYSIDTWMSLRDTFFALPDSNWHDNCRMLHIAPVSHGSGMWFVPTIYCGGCNFTINEPDLALYCKTIETERVNTAFLVPTILYRLLELPAAHSTDLSSLRSVYYGAAPISPAKLELLQQEFGNIFIQCYGSTEHFGIAASLSKAGHLIETSEDEKRLSSAGQVTAGVELVITDDEGKQVNAGETGEICLRSRSTIQGYFRNPEQTAKEFSDGFWKSGDIGFLDDSGYLYIVDRKKDMIISGGFNIYAVEVEAAIDAHPAVMMSAAVGRPHEEWGEAVHAEVVLRPGCLCEEQELIDFVKDRIGTYKAPKSIVFVDGLPMTAVGKVLRRTVREKYWRHGERMVG